jgi:TM2 domain-containing membrane protein YozV
MVAGSSTQDAHRMMMYDANKKSVAVAYLLWFFFGLVGGHRFYLGKIGTGAVMLAIALLSFLLMAIFIGFFTIAIVGIWALIDAFRIPGWISGHNNQLITGLNA